MSSGHTVSTLTSGLDATLFWRRKWTLLAYAAVSLFLGASYLFIAPAIFEAEARLLVAREGLSHDPKTDRGEERRRFLATQAEVLSSPITIRAALDSLAKSRGGDPIPLEEYTEAVSVTPMPNSDVLVLRFRSNSLTDTTDFLTFLMAEFTRGQRQQELSRQDSQRELFAARETALRKELEDARNQYVALRTKGPLMGQTKDVFAVQIRRLDQLHSSLTQSRNKRLEVESRLTTFLASHGMKRDNVALAANSSDGEASVRTVALKPIDGQLASLNNGAPPQGNLVEIEQSRALAQAKVLSLSQHLLGKHPDLIAAKEELAWWEQISLERKRLLALEMESEIAGLEATQSALEKEFDEERATVKEMDESLAREERLQSHIAELSKTHALALAQLAEVELSDAALADGHSGLRIEVLKEPEATATKVWPKTGPVLALSAALGLILGGVIVAYRAPQARSLVEVFETQSTAASSREMHSTVSR